MGGDCRWGGRWACGPISDGTGGPRIVRTQNRVRRIRLDGRRGWRRLGGGVHIPRWRPWRRRRCTLGVGRRAGGAPCAGGWVNVATSPMGTRDVRGRGGAVGHGRWGCDGRWHVGGPRGTGWAPPGPRTRCLGVARAKRVRRPLGLGRPLARWRAEGQGLGPGRRPQLARGPGGASTRSWLLTGAVRRTEGGRAIPRTSTGANRASPRAWQVSPGPTESQSGSVATPRRSS